MKSDYHSGLQSESFAQHENDNSTSEGPSPIICNSCGSAGNKHFCETCGNDLLPKRITVRRISHEVFHFFTHLDKGYLFTLSSLLKRPGIMQREYVEGRRSRYQKPVSMFFICLTVAALARYWIFRSVYAGDPGDDGEIMFFDKYMVLFHVILLPINALITYVFFLRSNYNYAEIGVLCLYTISFLLLLSVLITLFKFLSPGLDTAFIELPAILLYNCITNIHFFNSDNRVSVVLKTIGITICLFTVVQLAEDFIVTNIS